MLRQTIDKKYITKRLEVEECLSLGLLEDTKADFRYEIQYIT